MTWVDLGEEPHYCPLPGWWARRKAGAKYGATWRCDECGKEWEWVSGYGGDMFWSRVYTLDELAEWNAYRETEGEQQ